MSLRLIGKTNRAHSPSLKLAVAECRIFPIRHRKKSVAVKAFVEGNRIVSNSPKAIAEEDIRSQC